MAGHDYIGQAVPRREDRRLVTGTGRYVSDIRLPGLLDVAFSRSPVAHGLLRSVDAAPARGMPGVAGAWAAADLPDLPATPTSGPRQSTEGWPAWPALATDRVRYAGQPIAAVAANERYAAEDGVDAIGIDVETLPALLDPAEAAGAGAARLFSDHTNVMNERRFGEPIDEETWERSPVVVEARYHQQLLAPTSIEARAILVHPEPGGLTVWCSHQAPHSLRNGLAAALGLDTEQVRVIVPDVGGAFGAKSQTYPEYITVAYLARLLDRPLRWIEDRAEALTAASRGRGQNQRIRLAATPEGRILALETLIDAGIGGYPHTGDFIPTMTGYMAPGAYRIPQVSSTVRTVVTNTAPTSAYRGAGRPEAAYAIERTIDLLARRLDMDPAEIRRRNFVPRSAFPYRTPTGRDYDSGDYEGALAKALAAVDYDGWRAEQARRRSAGDWPIGIGVCSYVERSGGSPGMPEYGSVEACADGTYVARSGSCSTGQGHETVFAQVVASALDVDLDAVRVIEADTDEVPDGVGSFASRSLQVGGSALHRAALGLIDRGRRRMAGICGVSDGDVSYDSGRLTAGATSRTLAELVAETGPLRADDVFKPPQAFPFGCYVAVVEIDPELGNVEVLRLVAVDDYGVVVNPMVTTGQGLGSIAQGLGQALYEEVRHDETGRPTAGTLLDYLLPTISETTDVTFIESHTPNPNVPLGAKGAGEAGCIATPPAVVNAVADALDLDDPAALQMPLTPETCWRAAGPHHPPPIARPDIR